MPVSVHFELNILSLLSRLVSLSCLSLSLEKFLPWFVMTFLNVLDLFHNHLSNMAPLCLGYFSDSLTILIIFFLWFTIHSSLFLSLMIYIYLYISASLIYLLFPVDSSLSTLFQFLWRWKDKQTNLMFLIDSSTSCSQELDYTWFSWIFSPLLGDQTWYFLCFPNPSPQLHSSQAEDSYFMLLSVLSLFIYFAIFCCSFYWSSLM